MQNKLMIASLLSASTISIAATGIEGSYKCHGTDPYTNKSYVGTITISANSNANVNFHPDPSNVGTNITVNTNSDASGVNLKYYSSKYKR